MEYNAFRYNFQSNGQKKKTARKSGLPCCVEVTGKLNESGYFWKNIRNLIPAPSIEVLTISPLAMIVLRTPGKSNLMAISCPTNKRWLVPMKTPPVLILLMGAWKSPSMVWQSATTSRCPLTFLRASCLLSKFSIWPFGINGLYILAVFPVYFFMLAYLSDTINQIYKCCAKLLTNWYCVCFLEWCYIFHPNIIQNETCLWFFLNMWIRYTFDHMKT